MAAALVTKWVDVNATGTGDGDSLANAYTSLKTLADLNLNLVTLGGGDGSYLVVNCASSGAITADTTPLGFNGWTTSLTNYILIQGYTGNRATASGWKTDRYRFSITNPAGTFCLAFLDDNIRFDGLQIEMLTATTGDSIIYQAANTGIVFSNCRIRLGASVGGPINVYGWYPQAAGSDCVFWNCIFEKHPSHNAGSINRFIQGATGTGTLYNCIVFGSTYRAVLCADANVDVYDSAVFGNSDDFYCTVNLGTIDYCASDDNDGTNNVAEGTTGGAAWPNIFEDAANGDFRLKASVALIGAGGKAGASLFSDDIDGTSRGAAWDVGPHEYVSAGTTLALTGVSGTASVGAAALSLALALSGLVGAGAVGTLAPEMATAPSGVEAPASVGTMPPAMAAVLAGIEAVDATGGAAVDITISLTGNAATGAAGTVTAQIGVGPDITIPITGVSANPAYQISGVAATGGTGTVTPVEATDITLPLTGIAGTGAVGNVVYLALGGWAATGEIGTVTPNVSPPVTSNEAAAAVGGVGLDRSVGLDGVSANGVAGGWSGFSRPLTGAEGAGAVGTLTPAVTKAITGNAAATARGSVAQAHDVAFTGVTVTGVPGYVDTLIAGDIVLPLTGVFGAGAIGHLTCMTATPTYINVKPRKRILDVQPRRRILDVFRRRT